MSKLVLYEINTAVWLTRLATDYGRPVTLETIPAKEWDRLGRFAIDAIWLMGVWKRSPAGRVIAASLPDLQSEYRKVLPDLRDDDILGSPYSIPEYVVEPRFGGPAGLAAARSAMAERGWKLILDFVPNHLAPDSPWLDTHPDYFIQGEAPDAAAHPNDFFARDGRVFANGRDPYFAPWTDTVQVNAFNPELRRAVQQLVTSLTRQCDGVRCDMAMLMLNDVFGQTWPNQAAEKLPLEYWEEAIKAVCAARGDFLLIAEAYWDREAALLNLGFDFCYDKLLYDQLCHGDAAGVRAQLSRPVEYQSRLVRFLENHDEPRAASSMDPKRERLAALAVATLPGATLYFDGQFSGRKIRVPVQLGREPREEADNGLETWYRGLLRASADIFAQDLAWELLDCEGWPDNQSCQRLLAWSWTAEQLQYLLVLNFSGQSAQGRVRIDPASLPPNDCKLRELLSDGVFACPADEVRSQGLYVDLKPWTAHFLKTVF